MKKLSFTLVFMFVFVVGGAALGTVALASPPDHFTDSFDYSGSTSCGPFEDVYQGHLEFAGITKFDKQGNRVADVYHVSGWEKNWRSDRPNTVITAKREANEVFDFATGTRRESGIIYKQTAPATASCSTT